MMKLSDDRFFMIVPSKIGKVASKFDDSKVLGVDDDPFLAVVKYVRLDPEVESWMAENMVGKWETDVNHAYHVDPFTKEMTNRKAATFATLTFTDERDATLFKTFWL